MARRYASHLGATRFPWDVLARWLPLFAADLLGRDTLLRDGYLYAETPMLAFALLARVQAQHLFREPRIWLQRGERTHSAIRRGGRYIWGGRTGGRKPGAPLVPGPIGDRPASAAVASRFPRAPISLAIRARARVRHIAEDRIVVEPRYVSRPA